MPGKARKKRPAKFAGGRNIAIKIPPHQFDATVRFYRDTLGLEQLRGHDPAVVFRFGNNQLWLDSCPGMSQAEIWLEIKTADRADAADHFRKKHVPRCDDIEPLPATFNGFWINSPAGIVHLVHEGEDV